MTLFVNYICIWSPELQHFVIMSYSMSNLPSAVLLALTLVGPSKLLKQINYIKL